MWVAERAVIRYLCLPPTYLVSVPSKEGDAVIGFVRHLIYPESRKNRCLRIRRAICRVPSWGLTRREGRPEGGLGRCVNHCKKCSMEKTFYSLFPCSLTSWHVMGITNIQQVLRTVDLFCCFCCLTVYNGKTGLGDVRRHYLLCRI